jgi:hypothetical protein
MAINFSMMSFADRLALRDDYQSLVPGERTPPPEVAMDEKMPKNMQINPIKFDPEGSDYDMESAVATGMKPEIDPEDGKPHWGSVIGTTKEEQEKYGLPEESYMLLKGKSHETWDKAVQGEAERGFRVKKFGDRYYSIPAEINEEGKDVTIPQNKEVLNVRNVKNNNLGNIKLTSDKWQGMVDNPDEKTFVTFKSPEHGIRALAKVVQANLNATNSYETYVNRYASEPNEQEYFEKNGKLMPHLENYAKLLAESQGIDISKSDWIKQKPSNIDIKTWIKATARAEGGEDTLSYFTDDVIQKGLDLLK